MKRFVKAVGGMRHTVIYTDTDGRQVELEVCISDLGTEFLRACPDSLFQKKLGSLIKK